MLSPRATEAEDCTQVSLISKSAAFVPTRPFKFRSVDLPSCHWRFIPADLGNLSQVSTDCTRHSSRHSCLSPSFNSANHTHHQHSLGFNWRVDSGISTFQNIRSQGRFQKEIATTKVTLEAFFVIFDYMQDMEEQKFACSVIIDMKS